MAHPYTLLDKLKSPRLSIKVLARARLYAQLDQSLGRDVTVVVAPAGFGKSVLLTSWVAQRDQPTAWLSLDAHDNDLPTFVRDLALAIETLYPDGCRATLSLTNALRPPTLAQLAESLLAEFGDLPGDLVIVVDDYHVLENLQADALITTLVDHLPQHLHLVISSRSEPLLPLARWRLAGHLGELRASDIRFYSAEAHELLSLFLNVEIPASVSEAITARTEGWAAGLRLAALSLEGRLGLSELPQDWLGRNRYIIDYLMDEVFSAQVPAVQELLLKSSILDWMSEPLAATLIGTGAGNGDAVSLPQMLAAGLFVELVNEDEGIYRYHELFRDLLRERLATRYTAQEIAALHRTASVWFTRKGLTEDAVRHALAAGDPLDAARAVEGQIQALLNREEKTHLEFLLDLLPLNLVEQRAPLVIARAWILHFESRYGAYVPLLAAAEQLLEQPGALSSEEVRAWRGDIAALRMQVLFWQYKGNEAFTLASQAATDIPPAHDFARGIALTYVGLSQHATGHTDAARRFLRASLAPGHKQSIATDLRLLIGLCIINLDALNIEQVQQTAEILLRQASGGDFSASKAWGHQFLGRASYERNDLETAQFHLLAGTALRQTTNALSAHDCLATLALTYAAQGLWQRADETADTLVEFDSDPPAFNRLVHAYSLRARLALARGDLAGAQRWLLGSDMEPTLTPSPANEVAVVTRVRVMLAAKTREGAQQALELAQRLQQDAAAISSTLRLVQALALQALALGALDDDQRALATLQHAIELAQPGGLLRTFVDFGPALGGLLARLSKSGAVTQQGTADYVVHLLAAFPPALVAAPVRRPTSQREDLREPLTKREAEVLELLALRLTDREIADTLVISPFTVRRHVDNLSDKIGVRGRRALVERARRLALIAPPSA